MAIDKLETREELARVVALRRPGGVWAEIGVQSGLFSAELLSHQPHRLYMIDAWRQFPANEYNDVANKPGHEQIYTMSEAVFTIYRAGERAVVIRDLSVNAASIFYNGFFDFVYIDANHSYEAVKADIVTWWPKVFKGGVLAGHDYVNTVNADGVFGVKRAVDEFAAANGLVVQATTEEWPSWYIVKPEP